MPHGVAKLFASSNENQTLKEGLAVASDPVFLPLNPFAVPSFRPSGLWNLANAVWSFGGHAWREVWT